MLLKCIVTQVYPLIFEKKLKVKFKINSVDKNLDIISDLKLVRQLFFNIIHNSII